MAISHWGALRSVLFGTAAVLSINAAAAAQEYSSSVAEWSSSTPDVSALLAGTRRLLRL